MNNKQKVALLKKVDFLCDLCDEILDMLSARFKDLHLKPFETLFEEGSNEDSMYIILDGELLVTKEEIMIAKRGPGEYLGEMALLESQPRSATIRALTKCHLLEIGREQFQSIFASSPGPLLALLKTLSKRSRDSLDILGEKYQDHKIKERQEAVARIMESAKLSKRQKDVVLLVCGGLSDKEIARRLSISAYTVRDHLKKIFLKMKVHTRSQMIAQLNQ